MAGLHNRSIDLGLGEILLVPAYYVHKVETAVPSLSYSIAYPDPMITDQHDKISDGLVNSITSLVIHRRNALRTEPVGSAYDLKGPLVGKSTVAGKKRAVASAALRYGLRLTLLTCLGIMKNVRSFLTLHWHDFDALPEREILAQPSAKQHAATVKRMCEAEREIAPKLRKQLKKNAPRVSGEGCAQHTSAATNGRRV